MGLDHIFDPLEHEAVLLVGVDLLEQVLITGTFRICESIWIYFSSGIEGVKWATTLIFWTEILAEESEEGEASRSLEFEYRRRWGKRSRINWMESVEEDSEEKPRKSKSSRPRREG